MRYPGQWTAGLKAEEKKLFEELLGTNNKVLDRLSEICYNMVRESENLSNDYDSPNWALRQADSVGYKRALSRIIKLCAQKQERDPA